MEVKFTLEELRREVLLPCYQYVSVEVSGSQHGVTASVKPENSFLEYFITPVNVYLSAVQTQPNEYKATNHMLQFFLRDVQLAKQKISQEATVIIQKLRKLIEQTPLETPSEQPK